MYVRIRLSVVSAVCGCVEVYCMHVGWCIKPNTGGRLRLLQQARIREWTFQLGKPLCLLEAPPLDGQTMTNRTNNDKQDDTPSACQRTARQGAQTGSTDRQKGEGSSQCICICFVLRTPPSHVNPTQSFINEAPGHYDNDSSVYRDTFFRRGETVALCICGFAYFGIHTLRVLFTFFIQIA